jgi:membrane fusion protein, copper/silver efflux system
MKTMLQLLKQTGRAGFRRSLLLLFSFLLIFTACGESEREQAQQQQYEAQLQQQMIETSESFRTDIAEVLESYFNLKDVLVESDAREAAARTGILVERAGEVDVSGLNDETAMVWASFADLIITNGEQLAEETDVDEQRVYFEDISETMIQVVDTFKPVGYEVYVQSCPMVRDGSAEWLSREEQIRNPYHGDRMLNCGEVLRRI